MITQASYISEVHKIGIENLPGELQQAHHIIASRTDEGRDWSVYGQDREMKKVIDLAFEKLGEFITHHEISGAGEEELYGVEEELGAVKKRKKPAHGDPDIKTPYDAAKALIMPYVLRGDNISQISKSMMGAATGQYMANVKGGKIYVDEFNGKKVKETFNLLKVFTEILAEKNKVARQGEKMAVQVKQEHLKKIVADETERISEEVRFIRRFVAMHGKVKEKKQVLSFINSLQRAMLEKRIRRHSRHASLILFIQESLLKLYHTMGSKIKMEHKKSKMEELKKIGKSEKVRPSVQFIKRYIGIQGKPDKIKQGQRLLEAIIRAVQKQIISKEDPYATELNKIYLTLKIAPDNKGNKKFPLQKEQLQGLFGTPVEEVSLGVVEEESSEAQEQKATEHAPHIMCSTDFAEMQFATIGFTDKWLQLIGDPARGFTAMVFGKPKMGKSYLCIDFASYLATHFGKVLYVAREEKLDATLQKKLSDKQAYNENLFVSDSLPEDLSSYDFIFLDSVNKLGLTPKDIETLHTNNPGKSFVCIFQTTKDGHFKGKNEFQHDVDVVIEIPERGKAVQYGRFNQGGEMDIFPKKESAPAKEEESASGLEGIDKKHALRVTIDAELPIPLGELAIYVLKKGEPETEIISRLYEEPEKVEEKARKIVQNLFKEKAADITLKKLKHSYNDSDNLTHGAAYFEVKLEGKENDLKKIAGPDKIFIYDWSQGE